MGFAHWNVPYILFAPQRDAANRRRDAPHFLFETSKRKCAVHGGKEKMSGMIWHLRVKSPKTEAGRHELPTKLETPLPAALHSFHSENCVPAPVGTVHNEVQNKIGVFLLPCVPLRYALPSPFPTLSLSPIQLREGFPKAGPYLRPPSPVPLGVGFQRRALLPSPVPSGGVSKGEGRGPPLCATRGYGGRVASPMFRVGV